VIPPSEFVLREQGEITMWVDREITDRAFLSALANPDDLFASPQCQIVKDQRKIKVARLRLNIDNRERALYIKRYNSFSRRFKLLSPFLESGALRSLRGAEILRKAHIASARPVAAIEKRKYGILLNSFFISDEIIGGKTADAYWRENLQNLAVAENIRRRRKFIQRLGELFRSLHSERIYHSDLKDANILAVNQDSDAGCGLFLLDLEGVRRCRRLTKRRRLKNLVQLYRTLGTHLSKPQQLSFLRNYLDVSFLDRKQKRAWIAAVLQWARAVDRAKARAALKGAMISCG
jgi:tRNA A-37 threonylcarbamoyl transferase component Bud32